MGVKVNDVCRVACNRGWMNDLDNSVRDFLTPMIRDGARATLDGEQQSKLATWACKTSMVFEFTSTEPPFFTFAHRDELRRTMKPPDMLLGVFAGHYTGGIMSTAHAHVADHDAKVGDISTRMHSQHSTVSVGRLVTQVVAVASDVQVGVVRMPSERDWSNHIVRTWPPSDSQPVSWPPPLAFDNDSLDDFMKPFKKS